VIERHAGSRKTGPQLPNHPALKPWIDLQLGRLRGRQLRTATRTSEEPDASLASRKAMTLVMAAAQAKRSGGATFELAINA
jgi:hypothetical protein